MPNTPNLIRFDELPQRLKKVVTIILSHRNQIKKNAKIYIPASIAPGWCYGVASNSWSVGLIASAILGGLNGGPHLPQFKHEYNLFFRALYSERNNRLVKNMLLQPHANYISINSRGDLEVKRRAPQVIGIPIGRRTVPNPVRQPPKKWSRLLKVKPRRK